MMTEIEVCVSTELFVIFTFFFARDHHGKKSECQQSHFLGGPESNLYVSPQQTDFTYALSVEPQKEI